MKNACLTCPSQLSWDELERRIDALASAPSAPSSEQEFESWSLTHLSFAEIHEDLPSSRFLFYLYKAMGDWLPSSYLIRGLENVGLKTTS